MLSQENVHHIPEDPQAEMLRLLRDIHSVICKKKAPKEDAKPRVPLKPAVMEIMSDGEERHVHEIFKRVAAAGLPSSEGSVTSCCANLCNRGDLTRTKGGRYQLTKKELEETNA